MRDATLSFLAFVSGLLIVSIGACGGKVIVDGTPGEGGAGGIGGVGSVGSVGGMPSTTPSSGSGTLSGPGCHFPAPIGSVQNCNAMASAGPGNPISCAVATCDDDHNQFVASCTGETCICSYSPAKGGESFGCSCLRKGSCEGGERDCCPFHF
jgi:hypothetical protein